MTADGVALTTTTSPRSAGSTSGPTVSSIRITITPGCADDVPLAGKLTFCPISAAEPSRNSRDDERSRSRSCAAAEALATWAAVGLSAGSASSGFWNGHLASLSALGGRPCPKPLSAPVQSSVLNQSPESKLLRSSDLLRSRSAPACQKDGDWPSAVVASDSVFIRIRSLIEVACGSL